MLAASAEEGAGGEGCVPDVPDRMGSARSTAPFIAEDHHMHYRDRLSRES